MNNNNTSSDGLLSTKQKLSFLWIFAIANYIFCDFSTLFNPESLKYGYGDSWFLLDKSHLMSFAIVMQLPIMMIPLSALLPYKSNRIANITMGLLMTITIGLMMTIFLELTHFGEKTLHYIFLTMFRTNPLHFIFFSIIEITTTLAITWIAFNWSEREI